MKVKVAKTLKRSFKSLVEDPGFIGLYLLPFLSYVAVSLAFIGGLTPEVHVAHPSELRALVVENIWRIAAYVVIYGAVSIVLGYAAYAGIILKASALERGSSMSFGDALRRGFGFVPKLFAASVLAGLIVVAPFFIFMLLGIFVSLVLIVGMLIWILPMIYIGVRFLLYAQACVTEDLGPIECLKNAWGTAKGNFWSIFVIGLVFVVISGGISIATSLIPVGAAGWLGNTIIMLFVVPTSVIAFTFVYLGLARG